MLVGEPYSREFALHQIVRILDEVEANVERAYRVRVLNQVVDDRDGLLQHCHVFEHLTNPSDIQFFALKSVDRDHVLELIVFKLPIRF